MTLRGKAFTLSSSLFEILSLSVNTAQQTIEVRAKKKLNASNSDVIKKIAQEYEVVACQEEIPSMNDIFIRTVKSV